MFFDLLCKDQHAEQLNHQGGGELYTLTWPVAKQSHASAKSYASILICSNLVLPHIKPPR
eukprot:scaffold111141_cov21-Tisochrysis_lutea.AAC.1